MYDAQQLKWFPIRKFRFSLRWLRFPVWSFRFSVWFGATRSGTSGSCAFRQCRDARRFGIAVWWVSFAVWLGNGASRSGSRACRWCCVR